MRDPIGRPGVLPPREPPTDRTSHRPGYHGRDRENERWKHDVSENRRGHAHQRKRAQSRRHALRDRPSTPSRLSWKAGETAGNRGHGIDDYMTEGEPACRDPSELRDHVGALRGIRGEAGRDRDECDCQIGQGRAQKGEYRKSFEHHVVSTQGVRHLIGRRWMRRLRTWKTDGGPLADAAARLEPICLAFAALPDYMPAHFTRRRGAFRGDILKRSVPRDHLILSPSAAE